MKFSNLFTYSETINIMINTITDGSSDQDPYKNDWPQSFL